MKVLTCAQMGGPCEEKIMGATKDEMMMNGIKHLEAAHPQMAEDVKKIPPTDPLIVSWNEKFEKDSAAAPEVEA